MLEFEYETDYVADEFEWEAGAEGFGEEYEFEYEWETDEGDDDEITLASELLTIGSDEEFEQFIGKLFKKASRAVRRAIPRDIRRSLGGALKGLARRSLPWAGRAVGGFFGGPAGAAIGGKLAPGLGRMFGLELEGLSPEDQEFEVARRFVRLAEDAAKKAATAPPTVAPDVVARAAIKAAAREHAPGLLGSSSATRSPSGSGGGRWVRRGHNIVLIGAG